MKIVEDAWSRLAVWVLTVTMVLWALSTTVHIGEVWISWIAAATFIVVLAAIAIRAARANKHLTWTPELMEEQKLHLRLMLPEIIAVILLNLGCFLLISSISAGLLPMWVVRGVFFLLLTGWLAWLYLRRRAC